MESVLDAIKLHKELGIWIETTTLVIPALNDSEENFRRIAEFIKGLDEEIPWHTSRFFSAYRDLDLPPTPIKTLDKAVILIKNIRVLCSYKNTL